MSGGQPCCCHAMHTGSSRIPTGSSRGSSSTRVVGGCAACNGGTAAEWMQLEVTGIVNGESCSDCAEVLNGLFVVQVSLPHGVVDCSWFSPVVATHCAPDDGPLNWHYTLQISQAAGNTRFDVRLWQTDTLTLRGHWSTTIAGTPIDCLTIAAVTLPLVSGEFPAALCDLVSGPSEIKVQTLL